MSPLQPNSRPGPHIVILGGGFGGRYAAQRLALRLPPAATITLVDRFPYMLYTPMLTEAAGNAVSLEHVIAPNSALRRRVRFVQGEIEGADLHARTVTLADGRTISGDHIVLALGSTANFRKVPGAQEHSITMKTLDDARCVQDRIRKNIGEAVNLPAGPARTRLLSVVVAGGGYTGVETIAAINEMAVEVAGDFGIDAGELHLTLVESGKALMTEMPPPLRAYGQQVLESNQIAVRLGVGVDEVRSDCVVLSDKSELSAGLIIWDTGIVPNPLLEKIDCPRGKHGGVETDSCFQVTGLPGVWAIGDCAEIPQPGKQGKTFAPTAQNSTREGTHLADNILRRLRGQPLRPFTYQQVGELAVISSHDAVANVFGIQVKGVLAWLMWRGIYIAKMPGLPQKIGLLVDYVVRALGVSPAPQLPSSAPAARLSAPQA